MLCPLFNSLVTQLSLLETWQVKMKRFCFGQSIPVHSGVHRGSPAALTTCITTFDAFPFVRHCSSWVSFPSSRSLVTPQCVGCLLVTVASTARFTGSISAHFEQQAQRELLAQTKNNKNVSFLFLFSCERYWCKNRCFKRLHIYLINGSLFILISLTILLWWFHHGSFACAQSEISGIRWNALLGGNKRTSTQSILFYWAVIANDTAPSWNALCSDNGLLSLFDTCTRFIVRWCITI